MAGSIKNLLPSKNSKYDNGFYQLVNPFKYKGDPSKIIFRSSYERRMCYYCDLSPEVVSWSSEPIGIRYTSLVDNRQHTYWVDFWLKTKDNKEFLVEVKPNCKLQKPKARKKVTNESIIGYNKKLTEYLVNYSKFKAAYEFAKQTGMEFIIADESFLFNAK